MPTRTRLRDVVDAPARAVSRQSHPTPTTKINIQKEMTSALKKCGVSLAPSGVISISKSDRDIDGAIRFLWQASKEAARVTNLALGGMWHELGSGEYGERVALLRNILHPKLVEAALNKLANCASVYRRWYLVGIPA